MIEGFWTLLIYDWVISNDLTVLPKKKTWSGYGELSWVIPILSQHFGLVNSYHLHSWSRNDFFSWWVETAIPWDLTIHSMTIDNYVLDRDFTINLKATCSITALEYGWEFVRIYPFFIGISDDFRYILDGLNHRIDGTKHIHAMAWLNRRVAKSRVFACAASVLIQRKREEWLNGLLDRKCRVPVIPAAVCGEMYTTRFL